MLVHNLDIVGTQQVPWSWLDATSRRNATKPEAKAVTGKLVFGSIRTDYAIFT